MMSTAATLSYKPSIPEYQDLDPAREEIRLLTIDRDVSGPNISCLLSHASLLDAIEYTALSYCWGDQTVQVDIVVNGKSCKVGSNLHSALKSLKSAGIERLWVDALCINQSNVVEKALQIPRMRSIYQKADKTVIWLGEPIINLHMAVALLSDLCSLPQSQDHSARNDTFATVLSYHNMAAWTASSAIYTNPYWRRSWILQELAFSETILLLNGNTMLEWKHMEAMYRVNNKHVSNLNEVVLSHPNKDYLAVIYQADEDWRLNVQLPMLVRRKRLRGAFDGLVDTLWTAASCKATEPRDKIYSLLGLATDANVLVPFPSYQQSLLQLRVDMTKRFVPTVDTLELVFVYALSSKENTISWLPDWSALDPVEEPAIDKLMWRLHGGQNRNQAPSVGWHIARGTEPEYTIREQTLLAQACILDTLSVFIKVPGSFDDRTGYVVDERYRSPLSQQVTDISAVYKNELSIKMAFQIAMYHGHSISLSNAIHTQQFDESDFNARHWPRPDGPMMDGQFQRLGSKTFRNGWYDQFPQVFDWLDETADFRVGQQTVRQMIQGSQHYDRLSRKVGNALKNAVTNVGGELGADGGPPVLEAIGATLASDESIVQTKRGLFGSACPNAMVGDKICVVKGCRLPMVVRPAGDGCWQFIGTAWLHGLMAGSYTVRGHDSFAWNAIGWPPSWEELRFV